MEVVDDGWDCEVLIVDASTVIRLPRRREVEAWLATEARVLPELAPRLRVGIPVPERVCAQHGSMVYPRVPGGPIDHEVLDAAGEDAVAEPLAELLTAVHGFPRDRAAELGGRPRELGGELAAFEQRVLPVVGTRESKKLVMRVMRYDVHP